MAGETEVSLFHRPGRAVFRSVFAQVRFENRVAVQDDGNVAALDDDFLRVPLAGGAEKALVSALDAVGTAVVLILAQLGVHDVVVVQNLQFHCDIRRVLLGIVRHPYRQAVVASGRQLELEADNKVFILVLGQQIAAEVLFTLDCTIRDLVAVCRTNPSGQVLAVEHRREIVFIAAVDLIKDFVCLGVRDASNKDIFESCFAAVGLQVDRPLAVDRLVAVVVVFQLDVVDDFLAVEDDRDIGSDLTNYRIVNSASRRRQVQEGFTEKEDGQLVVTGRFGGLDRDCGRGAIAMLLWQCRLAGQLIRQLFGGLLDRPEQVLDRLTLLGLRGRNTAECRCLDRTRRRNAHRDRKCQQGTRQRD